MFNAIIRRLKPHQASPDQPALDKDETLGRFIWRTTGAHQFYVGLFAIAVAFLNSVPIDLQKRIIDGPVAERDIGGLLLLAAIYLGVVATQAAVKYTMLVYQGWISESAVKAAREQVAEVAAETSPNADASTSGQTANVIGSEIDRVGTFIGTSISDFVINCASLVMITAYMLYIEPLMAACALVFLVPQVLLATTMQVKLNVLFERQIGLIRKLGDEVVGQAASDPTAPGNEFRTIGALYRNRIRFYFLKYGLKTLLNLANAMGPLMVVAVGGYMVIQGSTTIGTVVAFVSGFERLSSPLRDLLNFYREAAQAKVQHHLIVEWVGKAKAAEAEPAVGWAKQSVPT